MLPILNDCRDGERSGQSGDVVCQSSRRRHDTKQAVVMTKCGFDVIRWRV